MCQAGAGNANPRRDGHAGSEGRTAEVLCCSWAPVSHWGCFAWAMHLAFGAAQLLLPHLPACRITISGMELGLGVPGQCWAETSSSWTARKMLAHSVSYLALTTIALWNLQQLLSVSGPDQHVVMSGTIGHVPICIRKNKPWSKLWSGLQKAYYTESFLPKQKEEKGMFRTWLKCSQRAWDAQKGCEILFLESNLEMVEVTNRHRCFQ